MSAHYSRIPNPASDNRLDEMEAAFANSDDEGSEDDDEETSQRQPLVPRDSTNPSRYDFDRIDYDYPPPGSPPRPSTLALPANAAYGNTNGLLPSEPAQIPPRKMHPIRAWISKVIPWVNTSLHHPNLRGVGGGVENDGVFANLTSKPSRLRRVEDADGVHFVPEETQAEAPPSYAAAQADAVPSYWETTIHAPAGGDVSGELIVDSLPTGSLFSFLWSMLVSVAFNFLGFVLTYLLHTTHAAKYGSRAGLGITLIQYGWALRTRAEGGYSDDFGSEDGEVPNPISHPSPPNSELDMWRQQFDNSTSIDQNYPFNGTFILGESAAAWLSFFLMTVGWFLFLSSVLGFWRVKRWERGILHVSTPSEHTIREELPEHELPISFTFPGLFFRENHSHSETNNPRRHADEEGGERYVVQEIDRQRQIAEVRLNDARLQRNLRAAGLI